MVGLEGNRRLALEVGKLQSLPAEKPVVRTAEEAEKLPEDQEIVERRIPDADEAKTEGSTLLSDLARDLAARPTLIVSVARG